MNKPTAQEIASEVLMLRTSWPGMIALVEGPSDVRLYERLLGAYAWRILPTLGWERLLGALSLLRTRGMKRVAGIADRDHRLILGRAESHPNLFYTDVHDAEIMMIESPALDAVLKEYGSESKIRNLSTNAKGVRSHVYKQAHPIACLRYMSEKDRIGLCFDNLDVCKFTDRRSVVIDTERFIAHMRGLWPENRQLTIAALDAAIAAANEVVAFTDHTNLCCGHDVAAILSLGLRAAWGSHDARAFTAEDVEKTLRLAYSKAFFESTALCAAIERWAREEL
ncbi:MAG: DUF4435 domain-containing protein [Pseudomonadota bacterium]